MKRLSGLVLQAGEAESVGVAFGRSGAAVSGTELLDKGKRLFGSDAPSGSVGAVLTNDRATVEVVLGALAAGCRLVSLPTPGRRADVGEYVGRLQQLCAAFGVEEVVAADEYAGLLEGVGIRVRRHSELDGRPLAAPLGAGFELVQFTSGSTGPPRGIVLTDEQLGANVAAILSVVGPAQGDSVVSWLPLSHDMGLVGMLFAGLAGGAPGWAGGGVEVTILEPGEFLRRPGVWAEVLSRKRGSFTAAPDFAYRLAAQRGPKDGTDLSALRCAIVGGEVVRADTLAGFESEGPADLGQWALVGSGFGLKEIRENCLVVVGSSVLSSRTRRSSLLWSRRGLSSRLLTR